jgi:ribonuclease HII
MRRYDPADIPPAPNLAFEQALWRGGLHRVAGLDEAGRGAWAGPVCAAAVILPSCADVAEQLNGVRDSKQMLPAARCRWAAQIHVVAAAWGVGFASCTEIDRLGIVPATRLAMQRALQQCADSAEHLLIDALFLPAEAIPQTALIKGDARSLSIAAASVLAKTARDALLVEMDQRYPGYGFAAHKGYGTAAHRAALRHLGACPEHRLSFAPLRTGAV